MRAPCGITKSRKDHLLPAYLAEEMEPHQDILSYGFQDIDADPEMECKTKNDVEVAPF